MKRIVVHHSAASRDHFPRQFWIINEWHKQRFNFISELGLYGGYNALIEPNGELLWYRMIGEETAAVKGYNTDSISVCLAGNFDIEFPTPAQTERLRKFLKEYGVGLEIVPHRALGDTECYGKLLSDSWARDLIKDTPLTLREEELEKIQIQINAFQKVVNLIKQWIQNLGI